MMAKSLLRSRRQIQREAAAYASLGAAFIGLLRDGSAPKRERDAAWKLADWIQANKFTAEEAQLFMDNTGVVFESDLGSNHLQPAQEELQPDHDDEPPF